MANDFWVVIAAQLDELRSAKTADDVLRILSHERNPYGTDTWVPDNAGDGFFAGSGGDGTVRESLVESGWVIRWSEASYFYVAENPDNGERITYIEGDIYRGDKRS